MIRICGMHFLTLKSEGNRSRVQRKIRPNCVILLITTLFLLKHVEHARNFISHPNKRNVNTHILIIFHDLKISASTLSYSKVQHFESLLCKCSFKKICEFAQFTDKRRPQYLRKSKSNDYQYSKGAILQNMQTEGQCEIDLKFSFST
jgi:hypothetical protein